MGMSLCRHVSQSLLGSACPGGRQGLQRTPLGIHPGAWKGTGTPFPKLTRKRNFLRTLCHSLQSLSSGCREGQRPPALVSLPVLAGCAQNDRP